MHFSKTFLSVAALAISSTTVFANPIAQPAAAAEQLEDRTILSAEETEVVKRAAEILETRQGWTCSFLGDKACQVKCFGLKGTGGYCNSKNVCTCYA
ncbi:hypothetical protein CCUS01_10977 [Colletotrichum cuscutae]|uniref:Invertebrate defensins family profile domain-containing protein n=2 Tax=Colletotrichum acutatum species complex TaxID=2707335 RepID=A0AAI9Z1I8_9PEZI|nr:uncharacterized protein CCOS01_05999 [Colletotrichum costaricense]KAI3542434.1 hypothetical protein CSPX01_06912 [Colletotrichum filicis]KAK1452499.1 hypothetical protein CCUS01_10977 [Colletotrichum cuscutae]KAK1530896.1 hypothetical protein CCOS01_05999 [Colletotrichum costaricense]KAK1715983.1 hypothetical protein BDP67DRAFT_617568 [Colletotrichum lupini]